MDAYDPFDAIQAGEDDGDGYADDPADYNDPMAYAEPADSDSDAGWEPGDDGAGHDPYLAADYDYDLVGADPDEAGLWENVRSDDNANGQYDTVFYGDVDTNPYVAA